MRDTIQTRTSAREQETVITLGLELSQPAGNETKCLPRWDTQHRTLEWTRVLAATNIDVKAVFSYFRFRCEMPLLRMMAGLTTPLITRLSATQASVETNRLRSNRN